MLTQQKTHLTPGGHMLLRRFPFSFLLKWSGCSSQFPHFLEGENVHSWVQCFCSSKGKRKVVSAIYGRIWSHYWTLAHFFPGFFLLRQTKAALAAFRRSMTGMLEDSDGKKRLGHSLFHYLILVNRFIVELLSKMFYLFIWNKHHPTGRRWYQERREFLQ